MTIIIIINLMGCDILYYCTLVRIIPMNSIIIIIMSHIFPIIIINHHILASTIR